MKNTSNTKRALALSALSLLLCISMFVGSTFAWFTDTATTGVNKIQAGTLKVQLLDENDESLKDKTLNFVDKNGSSDILWEPGATFKTRGFKIANNGDLAFKYILALNGINGDAELLKVIDFSVVTVKDGTETAIDLEKFEGHLAAKAKSGDILYIKGHMKETAGNEYKDKELSGIGITVYATQDTVEFDSKDNQYDKDAEYGLISWQTVTTLEDFEAALKKGGYIRLGANIQARQFEEYHGDEFFAMGDEDLLFSLWDFYGEEDFPTDITLDLNGKTLSGYFKMQYADLTFTVLDSKTGGKVNAASSSVFEVTAGTLIIEGGTYSHHTFPGKTIDINNDGKVTITGGTFIPCYDSIVELYTACVEVQHNGTLTIEGGTFNNYLTHWNGATADQITVTGGTFQGKYALSDPTQYVDTAKYDVTQRKADESERLGYWDDAEQENYPDEYIYVVSEKSN